MSKLKNLKKYRQAEPEAWEQRAAGQTPTSAVQQRQKKKSGMPYQNWLVPGIVVVVLLSLIGFVVKIFLSSDSGPKKALYQVTMIKHPPPEEKVKPPEPEQPKELPKEAIQTATDVPQPDAPDQPDNAPPPGADLGVAGEGSAGSDGFGLVGKGKGYKGKDITTIGGSGSGGNGLSRMALLTKYGWYTNKIQDEIKKSFKKHMESNGGVPKGKYEVTLKIQLDTQGTVKKYRIVTSSGNEKLDEALKATLPGLKISQAPPEGMPSLVTLKILSQG
jgi:TonB family protein